MGDGRIFLITAATFSLRKAYRMSLLFAWSISLDSTFKPGSGGVWARSYFIQIQRFWDRPGLLKFRIGIYGELGRLEGTENQNWWRFSVMTHVVVTKRSLTGYLVLLLVPYSFLIRRAWFWIPVGFELAVLAESGRPLRSSLLHWWPRCDICLA
jgi:hypothetical protein